MRYSATVANLQSKVEELTTSNALMKEDLDISRENILALMQENAFLKARQCTIQNWQRLNGVSVFYFFYDFHYFVRRLYLFCCPYDL